MMIKDDYILDFLDLHRYELIPTKPKHRVKQNIEQNCLSRDPVFHQFPKLVTNTALWLTKAVLWPTIVLDRDVTTSVNTHEILPVWLFGDQYRCLPVNQSYWRVTHSIRDGSPAD